MQLAITPATRLLTAARYSVFRSSCIVSCGCEVVGALGGREDVDEAPDNGPKALNGAHGRFAQERLELGEGILNRVEIRAVGRQVEELRARRLDPLWLDRLSRITTSPGRSSGTRTCST